MRLEPAAWPWPGENLGPATRRKAQRPDPRGRPVDALVLKLAASIDNLEPRQDSAVLQGINNILRRKQ